MSLVSGLFNTFFNPDKKTKEEISQKNKDEFSSFFENVNYQELLNDTLDTMSDLEKQAHLETLKVLKEIGLKEDELYIINFHILNKNSLNHELPFTEEEEKLIEKYDSLFDFALDTIKDSRKRQLGFKKLQTQTNITDVMLKSLDIHNNKTSQEYILKVES
ncbi:hypothetical protein CRV02_09915 [Arcobacter sp. CECT 8989]|uniref:hypothetical protein n=1 Tax=Arcobacter sp. CECT 8989 TaxID=2044509 RepID=UPI00100A6D09|nr:hypothetical protein [Arcobacter sp. CECT 8989]RXK00676.1 hypothetical protein CRV02_09915 [Arcobacter sp. CECT 8989]